MRWILSSRPPFGSGITLHKLPIARGHVQRGHAVTPPHSDRRRNDDGPMRVFFGGGALISWTGNRRRKIVADLA
jgi:hypothetical protein